MVELNEMNDAIEIITGEATSSQARLYVRLQNDRCQGIRIDGTLTGPQCRYARTLPARFQVCPLETEAGALAEAVVPDPCFWTPGLPFLYQLELEIRDHHGMMHQVTRLVGIRHWGVDGKDLRLEGRRTVLRGMFVTDESKARELLAAAHETEVALAVCKPNDALCEAASKLGVALLVDLRNEGNVERSLSRISRWPAVMVAVVEHRLEKNGQLDRTRFPGLIVAQAVEAAHLFRLEDIAPRTDGLALFLRSSDHANVALSTELSQCGLPIMALRPGAAYADLLEARSACDHLQAELAPQLDLAGYFV